MRYLKVNFVRGSNFGDCVFPQMLKHWNIPYQWVDHSEEFKLISTGSIVGMAAMNHTHVWGSGIISKNTVVNQSAIYHSVRGKHTKEKTGKDDLPLGDPALILPRLYSPTSRRKIHEIGIVPHQIHFDKIVSELKRKKLDYFVIDPSTYNDKLFYRYIDQICSCKKIITTTLHGLIVAHAYGIDASPMHFDDSLCGDGIKFHDYYSVWNNDYPDSFMYSEALKHAKKKANYWKPKKEDLYDITESIMNDCPLNTFELMKDERYFVENKE